MTLMETVMNKKKSHESLIGALYSRKKGWLLALPWCGVYGSADVILTRPVRGFLRHERVNRFHHWTIYFKHRQFNLNHPGVQICDEIVDPVNERVTRQVEFMGTTYVFYSGRRFSYYEKKPNKKEVAAIWIPDEKHKDDKRVFSVGLGVDIHETLRFMEEWRQKTHIDADL